MFSEDQMEQLRSFPEVSRDELIRYFTPAAGDVAFVIDGIIPPELAELMYAGDGKHRWTPDGSPMRCGRNWTPSCRC
jgi:hypothetical protein